MKPKEWILLIIVLLCTFVFGAYIAYISSFSIFEVVGVDLESKPTTYELVGLLIFLVIWYPTWCFIGLIVGLVIARPICGAASISALGMAGYTDIPVLSPIYNKIVKLLYEKNT